MFTNLILDGVMQAPGRREEDLRGGFQYGGWSQPYWDDGIGKFKFEELFARDAQLLGRVTYQGFVAAWPSQKDEAGIADRMNNKIVGRYGNLPYVGRLSGERSSHIAAGIFG